MSFACRSYASIAELRPAVAAGAASAPCHSKSQVQTRELASHSQRAPAPAAHSPCTRASWGPSPSCSTTPPGMAASCATAAPSPAPSAVVALLRAYRPALATAEEAAAFAVHATLLAAGFELLAVGEAAERLERPSDSASVGSLDGWNATPGVFSFLYSIPQPQEKQAEAAAASSPSPLLFVKCLVVAETLMVDACCVRAATGAAGAGGGGNDGDNDERPLAHIELRIPDVVSQPSSLSTDIAGTSAATDYNALFSDLARIVTTVSDGITKRILAEASQPAVPSASSQREHQQQQQRQEREQGGTRSEAGRASATGGLGVYPAPVPGVGADRGPGGIVYPQIGMVPTFDDINPGGSAGLMPSRGGIGGGSMLVGPDDPRWGQVRPGMGVGVPQFGGSGIGYDDDCYSVTFRPASHPSPGIPPGARFDPFGPPGDPGFEPGQFGDGGSRRRPGGGPGQGPGGIHSDLQFFNPPF